MAAFFSDFYVWLIDIWGQMTAGVFGRRALSKQGELIVLGIDGARVSIHNPPHASELVGMPDLPDRLKLLPQLLKNRQAKCVLRFEDGSALIRRLSPITLPASRLRTAALLDLEIATPFRRAQAHALSLNGRAGSSYAIVKRAILDPVLEACATAKLEIGRIDIVSEAETHCVSLGDIGLLSGETRSQRKRWQRMPLIVVVMAAVGTAAHLTVQYNVAIRQVESGLGQLTEEAKAVRSALDLRAARIAEIRALRANFEERKLVSAIWEELARVLPDSSFLTDMAVKDSTVSISGYSAAASSIIVALEGSQMFDQATFTAPVVKVPGSTGDRFAIDLKMDGK
jgi:general secretion pathway protein L